MGVAGGLALIWASLGVFGAITSAVNQAWGVEKQRSFFKHRLVSFLMLLAGGSVMIVALVLVSAVEVAEASWFGEMLGGFQWLSALQSLTVAYSATILLVLAMGLLFYFIPNTTTRFRDVWVGAVLTGVLWRLAFGGFSRFIEGSGRLTLIHGSIAAVVIFLLWIYVSSVILMYWRGIYRCVRAPAPAASRRDAGRAGTACDAEELTYTDAQPPRRGTKPVSSPAQGQSS